MKGLSGENPHSLAIRLRQSYLPCPSLPVLPAALGQLPVSLVQNQIKWLV